MRSPLIALFIVLCIPIKSQVLKLDNERFKGNIELIIEKSKKNSQDWREFTFDSLSRLAEKRSFRDGKLVQDVKWTYTDLDSILVSEENLGNEIFIHKSYFDLHKRLKKYEIYSPQDSVFPFITETNIDYLNGLIQYYNRILINHRDTTVNEWYKFYYSRDKFEVLITNMYNKDSNPETITFRFDKKGNVKSEIVDNNNPLAVIAGVKAWSRTHLDKYRIDYKYDKLGNWITKYSVTRFCKHRIETRKIKYK